MLPDVDRALVVFLKAQLGAAVTGVSNHIPGNVESRLPWVRVRRIGGDDVHPRFATRATVDVDVWAGSREGAFTVAEQCRVLLLEARERQTALDGGARIANFTTTTAPSELRTSDQSPSLYRYVATYSLIVRR